MRQDIHLPRSGRCRTGYSKQSVAPTTIVCRTFTIVFALAICAISYWLWRVPLEWYLMKLDDFDYLDRSRSAAVLARHLFTPHYGHVVPLFRLETYLLFKLAGSLEALPSVLGWASFATLVLATLLSGHVAAHETGRPERGVAAMAAVGFSSVMGPATTWYSAGQALACGTMILAMLAALQLWRVRGGRWPLCLGLLATMAAPLFWTVGYIAGLVGAAYLLADGRRRIRRAAILPVAVSVATCVLVRWVLIRFSADAALWAKPRPMDEVQVGPAITHAAQALCEFLLKNLGLDASTTDSQAIVIVPILAGLWCWTRGRFDPDGARNLPRINPLEAAGAVMMAASLVMIYSVRGTTTGLAGGAFVWLVRRHPRSGSSIIRGRVVVGPARITASAGDEMSRAPRYAGDCAYLRRHPRASDASGRTRDLPLPRTGRTPGAGCACSCR